MTIERGKISVPIWFIGSFITLVIAFGGWSYGRVREAERTSTTVEYMMVEIGKKVDKAEFDAKYDAIMTSLNRIEKNLQNHMNQ